MLVFNPQWQTDGQIISDFGCAPALVLVTVIEIGIPQIGHPLATEFLRFGAAALQSFRASMQIAEVHDLLNLLLHA